MKQWGQVSLSVETDLGKVDEFAIQHCRMCLLRRSGENTMSHTIRTGRGVSVAWLDARLPVLTRRVATKQILELEGFTSTTASSRTRLSRRRQ